MQGRTVVLSGTVASQDDAEVAAALAKLEPGVSQVQNELTVSPSLGSPSRGLDRASTVAPEQVPVGQSSPFSPPALVPATPFPQTFPIYSEVTPQPFDQSYDLPVIVSP